VHWKTTYVGFFHAVDYLACRLPNRSAFHILPLVDRWEYCRGRIFPFLFLWLCSIQFEMVFLSKQAYVR